MRPVGLQRIVLMLMAAASLYAAARNLAATSELGSLQDDPVAQWEKRFAPVRERLPFARGTIGYISDSDVPGADFDPANDEGEYILTQYALAPVVIVRGTAQEWNLANLTRASFERWRALNSSGYELIWQQNGLYLLHRTGR